MKNLVVLSLFLLARHITIAQNVESDGELIEKQTIENNQFWNREVNFIFLGKNPIMRYNPVSLTLSGLMFFYQKIVSPQISANCSYEISCSDFSKRVIQRYGLIKGIALSADRLSRCTKMAFYDLSPEAINENFKIIDDPEKYQSTVKNPGRGDYK